jgi:Protein of unknown function (DUF3987)
VSSRYCETDPSAAKLIDQLATQPRGMLAAAGEILGFVRGAIEAAGYQGRTILLESFDGKPYTLDRLDRTIRVPALHLSIVGGVQPDRLSELFGRQDDGFVSRFLIAWPDVKRDARLPCGSIAAEGIEPTLRRLLALPAAPPLRGHMMRLSVHGRRVIEPATGRWLAAAESLGGPLEGIYARARQLGVRLASVMELAEHAAEGRAGTPDYLGPDMVSRAVRLMDEYYLPCAERALTEGNPVADDNDLRAIALFIAR